MGRTQDRQGLQPVHAVFGLTPSGLPGQALRVVAGTGLRRPPRPHNDETVSAYACASDPYVLHDFYVLHVRM